MSLHLVLLLLSAILHQCALAAPFHEEWLLWKEKHGKVYPHGEEESKRLNIWLENKNYIEEHNQKAHVHGFTLKMNHFGDLTIEEYRQSRYATCYHSPDDDILSLPHNATVKMYSRPDDPNLPEEVDWRTKNAVTGVKDQGQCGSCYAFSAVGALEGAQALAHDKLVHLSEQNIVDCSIPYGNKGCNGGNMYESFRYIIDNDGIDREDGYKYTGRQGQCKFDRKAIGGRQVGIIHIPTGSEAELQSALATAGPVSVAIDGSSNAFRFYEKGVFDEPNCSTTKLTHAGLIIGYGKKKGKPYWLVKNSWGPHWGMKGYIMMARNKANQCGIATAASFPTL
ncbi:PREDICTED: cathepsin L1-like [Amphimedon queenslandica]|uniref:Cathepsin L n=1 Tax=Amphimedon queenslandica TaxID=400682 RepID=A0A1X7VLV0_AMPQE|nr:PREDICTED: cathepsin L1-like [Amphimedon queenslandica]|eukprot:XP_003383726.1 PREDICTED: cathepsin L1-like [Amphimedon queenslandica]